MEDSAVMQSAHKWPLRSSPQPGALPRRMTTRTRGRTIHHVSPSPLWKTCEIYWNLATIMQGAKKEMRKGSVVMLSGQEWPTR